jgi:hypothetical protein
MDPQIVATVLDPVERLYDSYSFDRLFTPEVLGTCRGRRRSGWAD